MNIDLSKVSALTGTLRKPHVNSTCIGCSACVAVTGGEYYELDRNGLSCVKHSDSYDIAMVDDSIVCCPVNAISWQSCDTTGAYLNGVIEHQDV
jgi:ferredoxin